MLEEYYLDDIQYLKINGVKLKIIGVNMKLSQIWMSMNF